MKTIARALVMMAVLASGCGNWSDEDAQFLAAIPMREDLQLHAPDETGTQSGALRGELGTREDALLGQRSAIVRDIIAMARGVNGFVDMLTRVLDKVRELPPSEREPNRRVWGPYDDRERPGFEVRVVMAREEGEGRIAYAFEWRKEGDAEFTPIITGEFRGERATNGSGSFEYAGADARAMGLEAPGSDANDLVTLAYDMNGGEATALLEVHRADGSSLTSDYTTRPEGDGTLHFVVVADLATASSALETLDIKARWLSDKSGRADVKVTGGDLGGLVGEQHECWNVQALQVYKSRNFECPLGATSCSEGDAAQCSVPPQ